MGADLITVRVQNAAFDAGAELNAFMGRHARSGAVASFVGQMRDFRGTDPATGEAVTAMTLEHYAGMAERQLAELAREAARRWSLDGVLVVHRHGELRPGDPIVLVVTASAHRADALAACTFLIDWLKTKAPFWKKERTASGDDWVAAQAGDDARAEKWRRDSGN